MLSYGGKHVLSEGERDVMRIMHTHFTYDEAQRRDIHPGSSCFTQNSTRNFQAEAPSSKISCRMCKKEICRTSPSFGGEGSMDWYNDKKGYIKTAGMDATWHPCLLCYNLELTSYSVLRAHPTPELWLSVLHRSCGCVLPYLAVIYIHIPSTVERFIFPARFRSHAPPS